MAGNKLSHLSPAGTSVSLPPSPRGEVSEACQPRSATDAKFQSPKQLLTSWLRTNSRKRTHSDSDNKTAPELKSLTSEPSSEFTNKLKGAAQNVDLSFILPNDQTEEHGTKDKKEDVFSGQKSPLVSPLKKRLCIKNVLNFSSHVHESKHPKINLNPGKENLTSDKSYCPPEEVKQAKKKSDAKCKGVTSTSTQNIATQSKSQVSNPAKTKNWLTEWSIYCKAKYGDSTSLLANTEGESTATETLTTEDSSTDGLQPPNTQVSNDVFWCTVLYFLTSLVLKPGTL